MPIYDLISESTGRSYRVNAPRELTDDEVAFETERYDRQAQLAEQSKPFLDVTDLASSVGSAFGGLRKTLPASIQRLRVGLNRPDTYPEGAKRAFSEEKEFSDQTARENTYRLLTGNLGSVGESIREAGPSLGFSLASMGAAIPSSVAGGVAGTAIGGPVGGVIGGTTAGMAASGVAAYRMAGSQFLNEAFNTYLQNNPGADEATKEAAYQELLPLAQNSALWEAGPEAIGNAATMGAGKILLGIGRKGLERIARSALAKTGALVGAQATELATETATQLGQGLPQAKAEAFNRGEDMMTAKSPYTSDEAGAIQAFKDVAPQTLALGGLMLGAGGAIKGGQRLFQKSPTIEGDALVPTEQAPPPVEEPEDDYGVAAFQQQMTEIAAQPDPIAPIQQTVTAAAENSVRVNANVLPATAAVIEAGGLAPAPTVEQPAPVVDQPRTREEEIAQNFARLRLNLSAEEREDMEQQLAQAQAEGAAADQTAEERRQAIQREDIIRRQQDREAELQRLAEERQRATAREQQRQQPPVVEETVTPIQPVPAVEETGAPEITPEQVPNVENVIDEPGAAEVGLGMEKKAKSFKNELEMSGVAYLNGDRWGIKQSSDGTFYVEQTVNGERKIVASNFPDIETAQVGAISAAFYPAVEPTRATVTPDQTMEEGRIPRDETPPQGSPPTDKALVKPVIRRTGSKVAGASVAGQQIASANASRIATLKMLNDAVGAYPNEDFSGIDPSQINEVMDYMISLQLPQPIAPAPTVQRDVTKPEQMTPEVGSGMEKTQAREGSYTSEERDTFTETPIEKRRDRFVVSAITGTVFDRFFSMAVTPPAFKDQQAAADALNASEYNKTIPLPVSLGQKDGQSFFVSAYEGQPEVVIQPTSSPASAPAPTVQRDVTKPEQMTPEEFVARAPSKKAKVLRAPRLNRDFFIEKVPMPNPAYSKYKVFDLETGGGIGEGFNTLKEAQDFIKSDLNGTDEKVANALKGVFSPSNIAYNKQKFHTESINKSSESNLPVSKAAVDAYKITLPEGYVRQGDLYVFQPSGTVESVTEEKAPSSPWPDGTKFIDSDGGTVVFRNRDNRIINRLKIGDALQAEGVAARMREELKASKLERASSARNVADQEAPKEVWQRSMSDYLTKEFRKETGLKKWTPDKGATNRVQMDQMNSIIGRHKRAVESALREGKPVSAEILADYPNLKPATQPKPAETELAQVGDEVTWMAAGREARGTVYAVRGDSADIDYFGPKTVPLSELSIVRKSGRRLAQEKRDAEAAASTAQKKPQEPEQKKPKSKFTKAEVASLEQGKTPEGWTVSSKEPVTVTDTKGKTWEVKTQFSPTRTMTLVSEGEVQTFDVQTSPQPKPAAEVETPVAGVPAEKTELPAIERRKIDAVFERILKRKSTIPVANGIFQIPYAVALKYPSLRFIDWNERSLRYRTSTKGEVTGDFNAQDSRDILIFDNSMLGARAAQRTRPQENFGSANTVVTKEAKDQAEEAPIVEELTPEEENTAAEVDQTIDDAIESTLTLEEKQEAAVELGEPSWSPTALAKFSQAMGEWSTQATTFSARLVNLFKKVLKASRQAILAATLALGSINTTTTEGSVEQAATRTELTAPKSLAPKLTGITGRQVTPEFPLPAVEGASLQQSPVTLPPGITAEGYFASALVAKPSIFGGLTPWALSQKPPLKAAQNNLEGYGVTALPRVSSQGGETVLNLNDASPVKIRKSPFDQAKDAAKKIKGDVLMAVLPKRAAKHFLNKGSVEHVDALAEMLYEKESTSPKIAKMLRSMGVSQSPDTFPWCATSASYALTRGGAPVSIQSARAFLNFGKAKQTPKYGDIVVMWNTNPDTGGKNGWGGHVGFYLGEVDGTIAVLSGNVNDEVNVSLFSKDRVLGYREVPVKGTKMTSVKETSQAAIPLFIAGAVRRRKKKAAEGFGSTNTVVTKEAKDQAAKSLRESLGQTNVGLNPETLKYAITVGTYYLEGGVRSFADFSAKMVEEFGEGVRKYLKPAYEALRKRTDIDTTGMDPVEGVETAPVVEAPTAPAAAPAAKVEAEAPKAAPTQATPRPVPAPSQEPDVVAIANDPVDIQREALGLPPIMRKTQEAYTFPQMWSDAEAAMQANPERGKALVKTLNDNPRNISALEDAILLRERVNRVNALDLAMVEFNKAPKGNNEDQRKALDDAITSLTDLDNALAVAGTEQGRSLNARKMLARQDYTLAKMISTLRAANDGDLSEADLATVTRLQKQIDETQKKLAEVESGQADRIAEAEKIAFEAGRKEVLKDIEERAKNEAERVAEMQKRKAEYLAAKKEAARTPSKWEEIRAAARARNAELRSNLYSDVVLVKAASMAVNDVIIGATYIAEGVTKLADWVSKMRSEDINLTDDEMQQLFKESKAFDAGEDLPASEAPLKVKKAKAPAIDKVKAIAADEEALDSRTVYNLVVEKMKKRAEESKAAKLPEMSADDLTSVISEVTADVKEFFPDITEREIRDLFSGYGKILMPSKEELAKQIRQLSALGKLQSAIEDAEAKRAPLKSGPQRDKATQAIRLQQKKLARELRMMGRDYEAGEEQLRSPLDAIKARLNNQIDDLAMEINTRKKAPRRPSVDYDKDTQELADLRDELKRISDFINAPAGPTFTELVNEEMKKIDDRIAELQKTLAEGKFSPKEDTALYTQELQVKRDERDRLSKLVAEARKKSVGDTRTQGEIDRVAVSEAKKAIAELERKIADKDLKRPENRTPTETADYKALIDEKKRLQGVLSKMRQEAEGRQGMTDEQRVKQAAAAIDKSIERMQKMLTSGNYDVPKRTSKTPETPELAQKRETRDKLRKQLLELRKLKRDALIDPIAKQLKTDKKRIQTRMDKLKKRMETGDFSKPEKRKKATDDELLALQVEEENLKEAWAKIVFERQLASRGPGKRLLDAGQQTINTARAVLTSFDVSAVLRQGGFIVLGNPLRGFRNLGPMFQAFGSDKFAKEEKFRLERRENFKNGAYQQSKLFLADVNKVDQMTQQEEAFMSRWVNKLPKGAKGLYIGSAIQGSQRAYTVFLNRLRMDTFDAMVANLKKGSEPTPQEMSAVANYINIATGRGDLGKFSQAGTMLNTVFFAPRLVASRFQILAGYPYFTASGRTKALVLREYGKFFAGATLVYVIGALAQGDDDEPIETDPRSSDFLKIRFGDTRVDPLSGLIQATVLVSRLVSGEKKQASGKIVPIRGEKVPYGADDSFDVISSFVRTKFSPIVGSAVNVATGKNVVGEPTDIGEETKRMLIPMSFNEMKETLEAQGVPEATALIMLQLFGMGVQTYTPGKK